MFARMQLGRLGAPLPDNVPVLDDHPIMQATAPAKVDRSHVDFRPALDDNDKIADCTCSAIANAIRAQAALSGYQVDIPTERVLSLYSAVSGYPAQDPGANEVAVLTYQSQHGFDIGQQTGYVGLWANVPTDNLNLLRLVIARMGVGYLGVELAIADQHGLGGVWDTNTPAEYGDSAPGSWGGHALMAWSYDGLEDDSIWQLATWGILQRCTTRWLRSRMEEAHALYHPQMIGPTGRNPEGFDRFQLQADIAAFAAGT